MINLIGIESPGLTASLAIGEYICNEFDFSKIYNYLYFQIFKYYIYELQTNNQNKFVDKILKIKYSIFELDSKKNYYYLIKKIKYGQF